jgi:serralysin
MGMESVLRWMTTQNLRRQEMRIRIVMVLAVLFSTVATVYGQNPPDINRWSGNTAFAPPQGYGMGRPLTLSWSIVNDGLPIDQGAPSNLQAFLNGIYGNQSVWLPHFQSVFDRWSSISGLSYVYQPTDSGTWGAPGSVGVRGDVRIAGRPLADGSSVLAYNYYPSSGGDMVFNTNSPWYANNGTANNSVGFRNVIAHEHGHGIGMPHLISNNTAQLMEPFIQLGFDGPQHHDILMAHRGYGDVNEKSFGQLGNDVAVRATSLGGISNGGSVSVGNSARSLVVAPDAVDFVSIHHGTDDDFYSFNVGGPGTVNALVEALGFTYSAGPQGGNEVTVNTRERSDLNLALFDTNGTSMLAFVNQTSFGGNEFLSFDVAAAGTYFVRVGGSNNPDNWAVKTQFYALTVGFTAIPEPGSLVVLYAIVGLGFYRRRVR